jgi:glycine cleavage system aminomethyltransferase T
MAGMEALSSMSMEKNYKHWHGDIETTDNPIDAGWYITK